MTDINELAQRNELLIANGRQTADLLRHLADNEIDSDYFAVVSECENYGKETEAELSITEFALRAAGYVDALVEALEKALRANAAQDDHINQQQDRIDTLEKNNAELGRHVGMLEKRLKGTEESLIASTDMVAELEDAEKKPCAANVMLDARAELAERQLAELESRTVTVKLASRRLPSDYADDEFGNEDLAAIHNACRLECKVSVEKYLSAHGIVVKWEAE